MYRRRKKVLHNQSFVKHLSQTGGLAKASNIVDQMRLLQEDLVYASSEGDQCIEADIDEQRKLLEDLYRKYAREVEDPQDYGDAVADLKRQLMLASNSNKPHFVYV